MNPRLRGLLTLVILAATALVTPGLVVADEDVALPLEAKEALAAFRKVPWSQRLKPERGDPPPDGWQDRLRAEWQLATLDEKHVPALLELLVDEDRFVRALAARSLGIVSGPRATPGLLRSLAKEKDPLTRYALIEALARCQGDGALAAVEKLQSPSLQKDEQFAVGLARTQLKGGRWDVASIRGEHEDALRTEIGAAKIGEPAPELALPSPSGPVNLSLYRGKVVILVFIHGDKGPKDNFVLSRMQLEKEFLRWEECVVVVVDPHEKERTKRWADRSKLPYVFCSDPSGRAAATYGVARQLLFGGEWLPSPAWFVIDRKGKLVWRRIGKKVGDHASLGMLLPILRDVVRGFDLR